MSFTPSLRLPDPCIDVLDERFLPLRLLSDGLSKFHKLSHALGIALFIV